MSDLHYELAIIGTGSGNMVAGGEWTGRRVAIIERDDVFGGTCLNRGCIPTKMFVYPADLVTSAATARRLGVDAHVDKIDWDAIRDRVFGRIDPNARSARTWREGLDGTDVHHGTARFVGPRRIEVTRADGTTVTITADQVVIATGSHPGVPEIAGLDEVPFQTSDTIMRGDLPERLIIIGGGVIAAEFAHVFSAYGAKVSVVHRGPRLLSHLDTAISDRYTLWAAKYAELYLDETGSSVARNDDGSIELTLTDGTVVVGDELLIATGRHPNTAELGLDAAGVEVADDGYVVVDEFQRTTAEGVWALGDVCSREQLKHVANQDARIVRHNLSHPDDLRVSDHRYVPGAVFTYPQIAVVGLTEEHARQAGYDVAVFTQRYSDVAYGWAMEDDPLTGQFCKLVSDRATGRLLGAHLIGYQASLLISPLIQAMSFDQSVEDVARNQYWIHPALTEVVENALLGLAKQLSR